MPIDSFCQKFKKTDHRDNKKIKKDLKETFPEDFSGGFSWCNKMTPKFELKDDILAVFKKKRNVPFTSLPQINEEPDRLERTGVLSKIEKSIGFPDCLCEKEVKGDLGRHQLLHGV